MADFTMKANDLAPSIEATLGFEGTADLPDLTGATVKFIMRADGQIAPKINALAVIVDPVAAVVRYDWVVGDTDELGIFKGEWQVTYPGDKPQTFPTKSYHEIEFLADLDQGV